MLVSRLYDKGLVIIWIFTFPIDFAILLLVLISINLCRNGGLFKRLGLQNQTHMKGWRGLLNHYFNQGLHHQPMEAVAKVT